MNQNTKRQILRSGRCASCGSFELDCCGGQLGLWNYDDEQIMSFSDFYYGYIEAALWTGLEEDPSGDGTLDAYSEQDICQQTLAKIKEDCHDFYARFNHLWDDDARAGHDFHLTRNGHGAGFWDGGYEHGDCLTAESQPYGALELYKPRGSKTITHFN